MNLTWLVIAATIVIVSLIDVWLMAKRGTSATISWTLYTGAKQYPIIGFAMGVLMGHLFWVQHGG